MVKAATKQKFGNNFFETMKQKMEVGDHATEYDLWQHGFAVVKVLTLKEFQNIHQEDLTNFLTQKEVRDICQEVYVTNEKREMLYAGASLDATTVMNIELAPSTLETLIKVDANITSYMLKRYANTYNLRGCTLLRNNGQILEQQLHMDAKSLCNC